MSIVKIDTIKFVKNIRRGVNVYNINGKDYELNLSQSDVDFWCKQQKQFYIAFAHAAKIGSFNYRLKNSQRFFKDLDSAKNYFNHGRFSKKKDAIKYIENDLEERIKRIRKSVKEL